MEAWFFYINQILVFAVLALSLNLLLGYAGQVSVAHAAFAAIGGFTVGYMVQSEGWNVIPAILLGIVFSFVIGALVALPALRLSVEFLILLTLAVSSVIVGFITTFPQLGGTFGLITLPHPELFGWRLDRQRDFLFPLAVGVVITYMICRRLGESPFGRVLKGIREDDRATQALGKNVFGYKVAVFGITSALAGFGGGMYSAWFGQATPGLFAFNASLTIFAIVIFGGMANLTGSLVAATIIELLDPLLRRAIHMKPDKAGFMQLIVYGILLVVFMRLRPQGVLPEGFSPWRRIRYGKPPAARVEMDAEHWVPKTNVTVTERVGRDASSLEVDAAEHEREQRRERQWQNAPVVLETHGITKRFGGIIAAEDLAIQLREGTITALVGPNGAGKTTVFNLLTGFIRPDGGSVKMRGKELVGLPPDKVARLGLVRSFQDVRLITRLSCLQNVMLAVQHQAGENIGKLFFGGTLSKRVEAETREKAMGWLTFVGMQDFADIPAGAVSYGQSKLISLARALATEAEVLLLDEPASGIDTKWVDTVLDLVEAVREQGRTVCIVEHNLHVVGRLADHTYFMELGRVTAEGTIEELTNSPRLAEAYFGTA